MWCTSEVGITRPNLYRSGPLASVACLCDEVRGRVYKGGPLPLWTARRFHVITKEELSQSYLGVTYGYHSQGMHLPAGVELRAWRFFSVVGGEGALDMLTQHHPSSPRELAWSSLVQELFHA